MNPALHEPARRRVPLPGGGLLTVRPVTAADADGLAALYDGLSREDRYRRFFSSYYPPRTFFERMTTVVERGGYGVVATVGTDTAGADAGRIVGEANYVPLDNGDGELGMLVAADQRGWLGPYMLDALVDAAAARGVPNLEAAVLVTNRSMLTLVRSRGYATLGSSDWVSVRLIIGTAGHTPVWPPDRDPAGPGHRRRVLVEAPGGRWHAQAEAEAAGLQVIVCSGPRGRRSRCPVLAGQPCPLAAAANAIVISSAPDDERWGALVEGHADLHPGVPVCVEPRAGHRAGGPPLAAPQWAATTIDDDEPQMVVDIVDRLASLPRGAPLPASGRWGQRDVRPLSNGVAASDAAISRQTPTTWRYAMHAIEAVRKSPATIDCDHTITEAADAMDRLAVGALVVVESDGRPVGIVTDRDLVIRAVARRFSPDARVDSVMSTDLITLAPDADLRDALKVFEDHAIRRLPLVASQQLVGMLTVDDLIVDLTADLGRLTRPIAGQVLFGHPEPVAPATAG